MIKITHSELMAALEDVKQQIKGPEIINVRPPRSITCREYAGLEKISESAARHTLDKAVREGTLAFVYIRNPSGVGGAPVKVFFTAKPNASRGSRKR